MDVLLLDMIKNMDEGVLGGENYMRTLENEGLVMEFDKDFAVSDELMTVAEQTIAGAISGEIVPVLEMEEDMNEDDSGG